MPAREKDKGFISRFQILSTKGSGGMGTVYKALDPRLDKTVALKVLRRDKLSQAQEIRFQKEAQILQKLKHKGIPEVYDFAVSKESEPYMVMEFIDGKSIAELIESENEINCEWAINQVIEACDALAYAHSHGVVHRDIKPENMVISDEGHLKILDFGIAKIEEDKKQEFSLTKTGQLIGTPRYMSPEQLNGDAVDGRSDIYALAVVLIEMITGRAPFQGENVLEIVNSKLKYSFQSLSSYNADIVYPEALDAVIAKCLAEDPVDRFQNMQELSSALKIIFVNDLDEEILDEEINQEESTSISIPFSSIFGKVVVLLLVIGIIAVVCFLFYNVFRQKPEEISRPLQIKKVADLPEGYGDFKYDRREKYYSPVDRYEISDRSFDELHKKNQSIYKVNNLHLRGVTCKPELYNRVKGLPLTSLNLDSSTIDDSAMDSIGSLSSLTYLNINHNSHITSKGFKALESNFNLTKLFLRATNLDDVSLGYLANLKKLEALDIRSCDKITVVGVKKLSKLRKLFYLDISENEQLRSALPAILRFPSLKALVLSEWNLTDKDISLLSSSRNLVALTLNHSSIDNSQLHRLEKMKNLRMLWIGECSNLSSTEVKKLKKNRPNILVLTKKSKESERLRDQFYDRIGRRVFRN